MKSAKCEHGNYPGVCDYCGNVASQPVDLLVYRVYRLDGISVIVKIDFKNKELSLVDRDLKRKQWLFAERGLEYMHGWQRILEAMQYAIGEATKELQKRQDEDTVELMKLLVDRNLKEFGKQK